MFANLRVKFSYFTRTTKMLLGRLVSWLFFFFFFWILLSGQSDAFHLTAGALSCLAVLALNRDLYTRKPGHRLPFLALLGTLFRALRYATWLLGRIIMAALHVSRIVLDPKMPLSPRFIKHRTLLDNDYAKVIFGNSITLTPGTITAELRGSELVVHQIDDASAGDILSGTMEKEISKIFTRKDRL